MSEPSCVVEPGMARVVPCAEISWSSLSERARSPLTWRSVLADAAREKGGEALAKGKGKVEGEGAGKGGQERLPPLESEISNIKLTLFDPPPSPPPPLTRRPRIDDAGDDDAKMHFHRRLNSCCGGAFSTTRARRSRALSRTFAVSLSNLVRGCRRTTGRTLLHGERTRANRWGAVRIQPRRKQTRNAT